MGLSDTLGLPTVAQNPAQRAVAQVAATRAGAVILRNLHEPVDRAWRLVSSGSYATNVLAGLPVIELTTIGARSGAERTVVLVPTPFEGDVAVLGTAYGQAKTPGWVFNLEAHPRATVAYRDVAVPAVARRAQPSETERIFELAAAAAPGYAQYRRRASHRDIRAFVLSQP